MQVNFISTLFLYESIFRLLFCLLSFFSATLAIAQSITIDLSKPGATVAPIARGQQIEEFNHQIQGGFYAQLISISGVSVGKSFTLTFYAKTSLGLGGAKIIGIEFYAGGVKIAGAGADTTIVGDVYQQYTVTSVAPVGATSANVFVWIGNTASVIQFDDLYFSETVLTATDAIESNDLIAVYPNPAKDFVNVGFAANLGAARAEISISEPTGKNIYKSSVTDVNKVQIPTSNFAPGVYLLTVKQSGKTTTSKLIIQ